MFLRSIGFTSLTLMCACSTLVAVLAVPTIVIAGPKFTSTWMAPGAAGVSFAGKKVVALVISDDQNLQVSGEEALVRELVAIGLTDAVAAYRMIPRELLRDPEAAKPWFERAGIEGVIALRLVKAENERTYTPAYWGSPYYSTLWGYYGYGWGAVYEPGYMREDMVVVIENLIFSVPQNKLLWAAVSERTNPKSANAIVKDLVKATIKEMQKERLVR